MVVDASMDSCLCYFSSVESKETERNDNRRAEFPLAQEGTGNGCNRDSDGAVRSNLGKPVAPCAMTSPSTIANFVTA